VRHMGYSLGGDAVSKTALGGSTPPCLAIGGIRPCGVRDGREEEATAPVSGLRVSHRGEQDQVRAVLVRGAA